MDAGGNDRMEQGDRPAPCQVAYSYEGKRYRGKSVHFDESGMLILCVQPAPINAKLALVLQFPDLKTPLELGAEVVWSNLHGTEDSYTPRGMGVKFIGLEPTQSRLLGELAEKYRVYGSQYSCYYV